jgi:hypothetical protein
MGGIRASANVNRRARTASRIRVAQVDKTTTAAEALAIGDLDRVVELPPTSRLA